MQRTRYFLSLAALLLGLLPTLSWAQAPTFAAPVEYNTGPSNETGYNNPYDILGADLNRDGKPDMVVANSTGNSVGTLLGNGNGTFQTARSFSAEGNGNNPVNLAVGDLNRDGNPDVVTGNIGRDQFSVFLGNGDGTLRPVVSYSPGNGRPQGIALADVNGDGLLDALTANSSGNTASVLLGLGNGTFQSPTVYQVGGANPVRIAAVDVNGDGRLDLLTANYSSSSVSVLLGNGNGTFQAAMNYPVGGGPEALALADVNGDGRLDLFTANYQSSTISVLLGNGNGSFQAAAGYTTGGNSFPFDVKVADVNGDGRLDLITAKSNASSNAVAVLLGNGDGTFQAPLSFGGGSNTYSQAVSVLDINADGRPDILVANTSIQYQRVGSASVLLNTTPITLTALNPTSGPVGTRVTLTGTNLSGATSVRFNGTAATFTVVNAATITAVVPSGATTGPVSVVTPASTVSGPTFTVTTAPTVTTGGVSNVTATAATVSGTLTSDGGAALTSYGVAYVAGTGTPTTANSTVVIGTSSPATFPNNFTATLTGLAPNTRYTAVAYATNNNGTSYGSAVSFTTTSTPLTITDLRPRPNTVATPTRSAVQVTFNQSLTASSASALQVFSAQRGGRRTAAQPATAKDNQLTFAPSYAYQPGEVLSATVTTVAQSSAGSSLAMPYVYQFTAATGGSGRGGFAPGSEVGVGTGPNDVALGDVDADGDLDLLVASTNSNTVSVRLNDGKGGFSGAQEVAVGNRPFGVVLGDVDGDGDLDVVTANANANSASVRLNDGKGTFSGAQEVSVGVAPQSLTLGDVDGDGDLDLVTANYLSSGTVSVRLNDGKGTFSGTQNVAVGSYPEDVALGDMDGDGDLDLLAASSNFGNNGLGTASVRLNDGKGTFSGTQEVPINGNPQGLALGDVDGDGDLDLLTANNNGNTVSVRLNDGKGNFSGTQDIPVSNAYSVAVGDVDADGDLDIVVASNSGSSVLVRLNDGKGTFSGTQNVAVGSYPYSVALGDLDGDGDLDFATANGGSNSASVRLNQAPPTITSFSPTSGPVGTQVTITGTGFTGGSTSVNFNGTAASAVTVASATSLTATVPAGATSGPVTVTTPSGTATSAQPFTVTPAITSLSPTSGSVGTQVTILGTSLTGATAVRFNGVSASFTANGNGTLTTFVPTGFSSGPVTVTTPDGTATSPQPFTVFTAITSFTPTSGPAGTSVTFTGTNLSGTTAVSFNGVDASFTANADGTLTATVPAGATSGYVTVTTTSGSATSPQTFTVTPTITSFSPTSGPVGTSVTITGTALRNVTAVSFNGTAATYTLVSATSVMATVPTGATTGPISVTTTSGTATSAQPFTVRTAPVANNDSYTTAFNTTLTVPVNTGVLSNDSADPGVTLTASVNSPPSHGSLGFNSNGSFTYTPNAGYYGSDSFTYRACDNGSPSLCSNPATVTINVQAAPATAPSVSTATPANVASTSATLGGTVSSDGGSSVTQRGVVYSSSNTQPVLGGSSTTAAPNGSGTGSFAATITGLAPGTTYYVQAYATNSVGTSYGGVQTFTTAAAPITATTWTGAVSTDWFTAGNWTQGVPTASVDATIGVVSSGRYPLLASGAAAAQNLTIAAGASLTQTGGTLSLTANLTNNGTFAASGGTVATTGAASQTLGGSQPLPFYNLTVGSAGASQATSASFQGVLTLTGNLATNDQALTLLSRVINGQAQDGLVVNQGGVVTGQATVQRAIDPSKNPGLGYRQYSAPVSNTTVADLTTSGFKPTMNPSYNGSPTPGAVSPFPTVYGYDDARVSLANNLAPFDRGFFSPQALSDPLVVGRGYTVNIGADQLVDFQGALNNGDLSLRLTSVRPQNAEGGWQLLGNPYPAPLDYSKVAAADRAGLEPAIYVYSSTSQYAGQYRTALTTPAGVTIGNPVLPLGQAYFARVAQDQAAATMTFRNSQRLTQPNPTPFQRTASSQPLVQLTLQGATTPLLDEATVYFEAGATTGFEAAFDAVKLPNPTGLNLATSSAPGRQLAIDGQAELGASQRVVPLTLGVPVAGTYTLAAAQLLNLSSVPVYLRDGQTGALVDLAQTPSYSFTISSAAAPVQGRFELVFSPQRALAAVPASLAQQVSLYPNPAKAPSTVTLVLPPDLARQVVTATLLDALGRVVLRQTLPAGLGTHALPLDNLATGVYALRLSTSAGLVVKRLTIE